MLTIGSLFSGIGGLELGLELSGLGPVLFQAEKEEYCLGILEKHWPEVKRFDDVRKVTADTVPRVDVLCGGFPCQDISAAGKGEGLSGSRSGLWYEFARVVSELCPEWVVVENVASAANRWVDAVRRDLEGKGYATLPIPLAAADVGSSHLRKRIFIVGHRALDNPEEHGERPGLRAIREETERWRRLGDSGGEVADPDGIPVWDEPERGTGTPSTSECRDAEFMDDSSPVADTRREHGQRREDDGSGESNADGKRFGDRQKKADNVRRCGSPPSSVAHADGGGFEVERQQELTGVESPPGGVVDGHGASREQLDTSQMADAQTPGFQERSWSSRDETRQSGFECGGSEMADADIVGSGQYIEGRGPEGRASFGWPFEWPPPPGDMQSWGQVPPDSQPSVCAVAHGIPQRVARLKALGNAVVPQCAEVVGYIIQELYTHEIQEIEMKLFKLSKTDKKEKCAANRCKDDHTGEVPGDLWGRETAKLCDRHFNEAVTFAEQNPDYKPPTPGTPGTSLTVVDQALNDELEAQYKEAEDMLKELDGFEVVTQQDLENIAEVLVMVKGRRNWLETREKEITVPIHTSLKKVRELFEPSKTFWANAEVILKQKIAAAKLREACNTAQALQEAADAAGIGDSTTVAHATSRITTVGDVPGISTQDRWNYKVVDASKVPRKYLMVDDAKLRAHCAMFKGDDKPTAIEGIDFLPDVRVTARSK